MTEQQETLKNAIENQRNTISEINEMSSAINAKKEFALKLQGVIEYLISIGVTLPEQTPELTDIKIEQESATTR